MQSLFFAALAAAPLLARAETASTTPDTISEVATSTGAVILQKVAEAEELLSQTKLDYKIITSSSKNSKGKTVYGKTLKRDVAVVGFSPVRGELKKIIFSESFPLGVRLKLPKAPIVLNRTADGCQVIWRGGSRWSFNRNLTINCREETYYVVGFKMSYSSAITSQGIVTDSYVPYSPELQYPEIVQRGKDYLEQAITQAKEELTEAGVKSRAFPDKNVSDIVPSEFVMSLILNEHMDHGEFIRSLNEGSFPKLVEKIWVIAGLNQEKAMRWSISSTGACCLTQFMPATYKSVVKKYPEAELDPSITKGRQEHINAVKASIILFDQDIASAWKAKTKETCFSSSEMLEKCLAASYNAGPGTLNKAVRYLGSDWDIKVPGKIARLKTETMYYLKKLTNIKKYLLALKNR